jgi:hypothetical protein
MGRRTKLTCVAGLGLSLAAIPATAVGSTGGIVAGSPARITGVSCVKSCVSADEAQAGSIVRLRGHELQNTGRVVFLGRTGDADNVSAGVRRRDARPAYVDVKVPAAARSGPVLALERSDGSTSLQSPGGITVDHGVDPRGAGSIRGNGVVAKLESRTVYFAGKRGQRLAYSLTGSQAVPVRVDLVKVADGSVVQSWSPGAVNPGATQTIEWKGIPLRGAHNYGTAENRYGAPRSGHSHAGQDVLAACGTPLVAARGGKVVEAGYEGAGGNAVVIHGTGSNFDNVYMHLRDAPLVHNGQRVYTGQLIGFVGETGDASVCHLHFEVWQGAWWNGGHTIDPLPSLKAWDALS